MKPVSKTTNVWLSLLVLFTGILLAQESFAWVIQGAVYGGSNPLPGTKVTALNASDQSEVGSSITDASGNYAITVNNGSYNLLIAPPLVSELANSVVNGVAVNNADVIQTVVMVQQAVLLSGVLRLPDGTAVNGVEITILEQTSGTEVGQMTTGLDGSYSFPVSPGVYKIDLFGYWVFGMNFPGAPSYFFFKPVVSNLEVSSNTFRDITIPFVTLSGKTTDGNGVPVPEVELQQFGSWIEETGTYYWNEHDSGRIKSDASGNYKMLLFPHASDITVIPPANSGFAQMVYPNVTKTGDTIRDFVLNPAITLSGVLRLPDGTAVKGVEITIKDQSSGTQVGKMTTGLNGSYSFPVSLGTYKMDLYGHWAFGLNFPGAPSFFELQPVISNLEVSSNIVRDITIPFVTLSGKITDGNGVPVSGVELQQFGSWTEATGTYYMNKNDPDGIKSDASGNYKMLLFPHATDITVIPPANSGFAQTVYPNVSITGDTTRDFVLNSAITLSGVLRLPDGAVVNGVEITIKDQSSGAEVGQMTTGVDGRYSFPISPGIYKIDLYGHWAFGMNFPGAPSYFFLQPVVSSLEVRSNTVRDITIPFVTLSGRTTDSNGVGVSGVEVQQYDYWTDDTTGIFYYIQHESGAVKSDASGDFKMHLFPHEIDVTVIPPANSGFAQTPISGINITQDVLQNIILSMPDTSAPLILSGPVVSTYTDTTATIEWQTNEPAKGEVVHGTSNPSGTTVIESTFSAVHAMPLTGLSPNTTYYVQVTASDPTGNGPVESTVVSFRTKPIPDIKSPVIIEGPIVTTINYDSAIVQWRTDEPSTGTLSYGLTEGLENSEISSVLSTSHQVTLTGLGAQSLYYLQVSPVDGVGNGPILSPILCFTTVAAPDMTAPVIIEGPMILDISDSGATVFWTTDEPATSGVSYNDGTVYGVYQDDALVTAHTVRLTGLTASTPYELTVSSKDGQANGPALGGPNSFATLATADTNSPVIIESPLIVNITHQSVVIRWETDEPANGVIGYGLAVNQLNETESHAALKQSHNLTITGLEGGTEYFFRVLSSDAQGNGPVFSRVYSFTTDPVPTNKKPELTKQPEVIHKDDDQITIAWETDKPTDTVVEYEGTDGEKKRRSDGEKEQKHQVTLVGLERDTNYSISVLATDGDGNQLLADIGKQPVLLASTGAASVVLPTTVLTDPAADGIVPLISQGPEVIGISDTLVTLRWVTDEIADSMVSYGLQGQMLNLQAGDISDVTEHIIVLTNLTPNTSYDFRVFSIDANGNGPTISPVLNFTTGTTADSNGPGFNTPPTVTLVSESGVVIEWSTDEAATALVRYGTTSDNLDQIAAVEGLALTRSIVIHNLLAGTTYYFSVEVTDSAGNPSVSSEVNFTTSGYPLSDTTPPGTPNVYVPYGDLDNDGITSSADALPALQMAIGMKSVDLKADLAPLVNGVPVPDGKVTAADALVILRKAVGLW
jgi:hypothetical protein